MGAILARFRKAKTTEEVLEGLEEKIVLIESYSQNTQEQKKRFVRNFLSASVGVLLIFIIFYVIYFPPTLKERFMYTAPLFIFLPVILYLRKLFDWYFQRKLNQNSKDLKCLRTEKKKILEQVMDKETYKVAVNLLSRFGDKGPSFKSSFALTPRPNLRPNSGPLTPVRGPSNTFATPRPVAPVGRAPLDAIALTPQTRGPHYSFQSPQPRPFALTPQARPVSDTEQVVRRRTPFPIINQQEKSVFERIVDRLIGDGPQDRFAMICQRCSAHNGMVLKEDFEYATFRCAFCEFLNPARKERPVAPRLSLEQRSNGVHSLSDSDSSSSDSGDAEGIETSSDSPPTARLAHLPRIETTEASPMGDTNGAASNEENGSEGAVEDPTEGEIEPENTEALPEVAQTMEADEEDLWNVDALQQEIEEISAAAKMKDELKKEM